MNDFASLSAGKVIKPEYLLQYQADHRIIYDQLIWIHNNLFVIERIVKFPFTLFNGPDPNEGTFWTLTSKAMFDSTVLALWRTCCDNGGYSLAQFKNKIVQTYILDERKIEFQKLLKNDQFQMQRKEVCVGIEQVRNHHIAHIDYKSHAGIVDAVPYNVPLKAMQGLLSSAHELLATLSFGYFPSLALWQYAGDASEKFGVDIDRLLAFVASQSIYLKKYEDSDPRTGIQKRRIDALNQMQKDQVELWRSQIARFKI